MRRALRRATGDRGAVIPLLGLVLPVLVLATAFSVDLGRQRALRRDLQADADVIALDIVRMADGRTESQIVSPQAYVDAVNASFARNNVPTVAHLNQLAGVVEWGTWSQAQCGSIVTNPDTCFVPTGANDVPNAVQVTLDGTIDYFFQPGTGAAKRSAVAHKEGVAQFQIGSFAARIATSRGTILPLLGNLLGLNASVDLVGFEGLADSYVTLGPLLVDLDVLDPEQVAGTVVQLDDFYLATAEALRRNGTPGDIAKAQLIEDAVTLGIGGSVDLGDLLYVAPGAGDAALDASVNAFDLLVAAAQAANGVSGAEVSDVGLNLPGVANVTGDVDIIQPPVPSAIGPVGTSARTDQVRVILDGTILGTPPLSTLANAPIRMDLGTANGEGEIVDIRCSEPMAFDVEASTSLLKTTVEVDLIIDLGLVDIPVTVIVEKLPPGVTDVVTFTADPVPPSFFPPRQEVGLTSLGLASGYTVRTVVGGTVSPLLQPLFNSLLNPLVDTITGPLLTHLDATVLAPLVEQVGLNLAGADLIALDERCHRPVLVE